jgi:hypothetical protein
LPVAMVTNLCSKQAQVRLTSAKTTAHVSFPSAIPSKGVK